MKSDNKRRHMTNPNNNNLSVDEHTMRLAIIALIFKRHYTANKFQFTSE